MLVGVLLLFSWDVPGLTTYNVTDNRMAVVHSWKKKLAGQWFQSWEKNCLILKRKKQVIVMGCISVTYTKRANSVMCVCVR